MVPSVTTVLQRFKRIGLPSAPRRDPRRLSRGGLHLVARPPVESGHHGAVVSVADPPWQYRLSASASFIRPALQRLGLLSSPVQTPLADPRTPLRALGALGPACSLTGRSLAWASHLLRRWLGLLHARYARCAGGVRQPAEQQPGCGFPVAHLLALFHAGTGLLTQLVVAPLNTHDLARMREVHSALQSGDVLVADRGVCSYAHLALLTQAGLHALLRVQARQIVDFTPARPFVMPGTRRTPEINGLPRSRWLKAHGKHDQLVEWFKPKTCPPWLDQETFKTLPPA